MKKSLFTKIFLLVCIIVLGVQHNLISQDFKKEKSDTSWKYLGRPRPGLTPLRFPPDSLLANNNWMWHGTPVFSPDFKEMSWGKYDRIINRGQLVYIKYLNGFWTSMQYVPFGNLNYFETNPFYSYSGDTLFFHSQRPGGFIFRVCRTQTGWTEPIPLNIPVPSGYNTGFAFSIAKSSTIYFELYFSGPNAQSDIYKSKFVNGQYQMPENLGIIINSDSSEVCPYIDPDERFLLFSSKRPGGYGLHDIFVSSRRPDSSWNNPVNLGPAINTSFEDVFPAITPDNLYFFFTTAKYPDIGYNPYWISLQYIYNLISIGIEEESTNVKDFSLFQNYPNPFNPTTNIKYSIPKRSPTRLFGDDRVKLIIYNILGKEIKTLVNEKQSPGVYEVFWDASKYPSGIYFYRLTTNNISDTKKMLLVK